MVYPNMTVVFAYVLVQLEKYKLYNKFFIDGPSFSV